MEDPMIDQIQLFSLEEVIEKSYSEETKVDKKTDKRSFASEAVVYLYKIEDKKNNKVYIGITDNFDKRFGEHKAGNHVNKDFVAAYQDHAHAFEFSVICSFIDKEYCSKGNNSRSHAIESLAIALYNSLNSGYNRRYMFHHDFRDNAFWVEQSPPELLHQYLDANHDLLNGNVSAFVKKPPIESTRKSGKTYDIVAKKIIQKRLLELKALDIKFGKLGEQLVGIDRSNLHKFTTNDLTALGVKRSLKLIHAIEDFLGMKDHFDFESAYLVAIALNK